MPLVTTTEMFKKAYNSGYAIGAFNVNNMEIVQGITEAAKEVSAPLILQVSKGARAYANQAETWTSSSTPARLPSSASTTTPWSWAYSTTFLVISMFSAKGLELASSTPTAARCPTPLASPRSSSVRPPAAPCARSTLTPTCVWP